MKAAVLGVGRMGTAIAWAMNRLGFESIGIDSNPDAVKSFRQHVRGTNGAFYLTDEKKSWRRALRFEKPDIVISSLPYHQTEKVAMWCIDNETRYCDLGGRVDVSKNINDRAKEAAAVPVMTDLGLAPGWVNILAEEGYRKLYGNGEVTSIEMMVGGLPDYLESNNNPLRYGVTWSVDGLINEYRDSCLVLSDGKIVVVEGMDGLENVETKNLGKLEAFYTSGGASHSIHSMKERGVKNCSYKTLRYKGHCEIVKFLIRNCDLDDKTLDQIFTVGCGLVNRDEVIIMAKVSKDNKVWSEEKLIKSDDRFSAMQIATAFPISAVASLMAEGVFDGENLSYSDIPFDKFNEKLDILFSDET